MTRRIRFAAAFSSTGKVHLFAIFEDGQREHSACPSRISYSKCKPVTRYSADRLCSHCADTRRSIR